MIPRSTQTQTIKTTRKITITKCSGVSCIIQNNKSHRNRGARKMWPSCKKCSSAPPEHHSFLCPDFYALHLNWRSTVQGDHFLEFLKSTYNQSIDRKNIQELEIFYETDLTEFFYLKKLKLSLSYDKLKH